MPDSPDNIIPITKQARSAAQEFGAAHDRELLTILFTDLVDSTRLQSELGNVEAARLTELHRKIVRDELAKYDAREIEWAGDSCLAVFSKPSEAVVFALRMQAQHRHVRESEPKLPLVRVGMHLGEIVVKKSGKKDDLFGLQVSEAARVMSVARGNQIFCTRAVFDNARSALKGRPIADVGDAVWVSYGAYLLKGSEEPVELCEIGSADISVLRAPETNDKVSPVLPGGVEAMRTLIPYVEPESKRLRVWQLAIAAVVLIAVGALGYRSIARDGSGRLSEASGGITSLAVLPLDNYSNDPEQEYFVDGMTDALTAELSKIGSLKVIARTSAMRFKDSDLPIRDIAKELGVDGVIEGSVYRSGNDVRITAQLVRGDTEEHVWSQTYEESIENIIKLQGQVAVAIVEELRAAVTSEEQSRIALADATNPQAYDAYLRAQHALLSRSAEAFDAAIEHFESAIDRDPEFAPAYAGLAQVTALRVGYGLGDPVTLTQQSRDLAARALELNPDLAEAHAALGLTYTGVTAQPENWRQAERHFRRAIELRPGYAMAHSWLGFLFTDMGQLDRGLPSLERGTELDPKGFIPRTMLAENLIYRREYDKAERILTAVLQDDPQNLLAALYYEMLLGARGYTESSVSKLEDTFSQLTSTEVLGLEGAIGAAYAAIGRTAEAEAILNRMLERGGRSPLRIAQLCFALGRDDEGFKWLRERSEHHSFWPMLRNSPNWDYVRDDRRYWELMRDRGFPPFPPEHPLYEKEQEWKLRFAAEEIVAAQPKPVRRLSINLDPLQPVYVLSGRSLGLSPDGSVLVYVSGRNPQTYLAMRRMDTGETSALPGTEGGRSPFFSPDGEWVAYYDSSDERLKKTPVRGGTVVSLSDAQWWGGVWGVDGYIYYSADDGIFRIPDGGGEPERMTSYTEGDVLHIPGVLLPDSNTLLFTGARSPSIDDTYISRLSVDSKQIQNVREKAGLPEFTTSSHLVFVGPKGLLAAPFDARTLEFTGSAVPVGQSRMMRDVVGGVPTQFDVSASDTLVYVSEAESDPFSPQLARVSSLVWVDRGGDETPLEAPNGYYVYPRLSSDGRKLAINIVENAQKTDIWTYDLERGGRSRLTFGPIRNMGAVWAADGSRLAFMSDRRRISSAYWMLADGTGEAELLLNTGQPLFVMDWASKLEALVVRQQETSNPPTTTFFLVRPNTDEAPQRILDTPFQNVGAQLSPDENWIAYSSNPSGRSEVFVQKFPEMQGRWQISTNGGHSVRWSPDGSELFYRDGESVVAVPVETEPEFRAGQPEKLFEDQYQGLEKRIQTWDVAPDGRFLMLKPVKSTTVDEEEPASGPTELGVVLNWTEELKRIAPVSDGN